MHLERRLTAAECEDLKAELDDWQPDEWKSQQPQAADSVEATLTAEDVHRVERLVADLQPANDDK